MIYVYPVEGTKTSLYYAMQFLKVHLPNIVIKVYSCMNVKLVRTIIVIIDTNYGC